jgi:hypothetical protein
MREAEALTRSLRHVLDAHAVYLSDADEAEITRRQFETDDVGKLALRTCLCGARIDGFDAYWEHLSDALTRDATTT